MLEMELNNYKKKFGFMYAENEEPKMNQWVKTGITKVLDISPKGDELKLFREFEIITSEEWFLRDCEVYQQTQGYDPSKHKVQDLIVESFELAEYVRNFQLFTSRIAWRIKWRCFRKELS